MYILLGTCIIFILLYRYPHLNKMVMIPNNIEKRIFASNYFNDHLIYYKLAIDKDSHEPSWTILIRSMQIIDILILFKNYNIHLNVYMSLCH